MRELDFLNYEIKLTFKSEIVELEKKTKAKDNSVNILLNLFRHEDIGDEIMESCYFRENYKVLYVFFDNVALDNEVKMDLIIESAFKNSSEIGDIQNVSVKVTQDSCPADLFDENIPASNLDSFILLFTPKGNKILYVMGKLKAVNDRALRMCYTLLRNEQFLPSFGDFFIEPNIEDKEELAKISNINDLKGCFRFY